jgi:hypothetical protein
MLTSRTACRLGFGVETKPTHPLNRLLWFGVEALDLTGEPLRTRTPRCRSRWARGISSRSLGLPLDVLERIAQHPADRRQSADFGGVLHRFNNEIGGIAHP